MINWGDGNQQTVSNLAAGMFSVAHRDRNIPHGAASNYTVSLTAADNDTSVSAISTATVTVNNVAPTANAGGNQSGAIGAITTLHGTATDPGTLDTFTYLWHLVSDDSGRCWPIAAVRPMPSFRPRAVRIPSVSR